MDPRLYFFSYLINSLSFFYNISWSHLPLNYSTQNPSSYPPYCVSFFFLTHGVQLVLPIYPWMYMAFHLRAVNPLGTTPLERTVSPSPSSHQLPKSLLVRDGTWWPPPLSWWDFVWPEFTQILYMLSQLLWMCKGNFPAVFTITISL